jgi:hypothetical protein
MFAFDPKRTSPSLTSLLPATRHDPLRCFVLSLEEGYAATRFY